MGIFKSREQKDVELAINYLNEFLIEQFKNWNAHLYRMISPKAASENPLEKVEPFLRIVWVEAYKASMQMVVEGRKNYFLVKTKTPSISNVLSHSDFEKALSDQSRRIGESVGKTVRELCDLKPDWYPSLIQHLEDPLMAELKNKAKEELKDYLDINREFYS